MERRAGDGAEGGGGGGGADGDIEVDELPVPEGGDAPDDRASNATEEEVEAPADVELLDDVLFNDEELFADISGEFGGEECAKGWGGDPPAVPESGAAASSGDVMPPPPPVAPRPDRPARTRALFVLHVAGGCLKYYGMSENLVAECGNAAHGKCHKTKVTTLPPAGKRGKKGQGRPVGALAAWLAQGADRGTKEEHWKKELGPTFAERRAARDSIKELESGDSIGILGAEEDRPGEGSEPEEFDL